MVLDTKDNNGSRDWYKALPVKLHKDTNVPLDGAEGTSTQKGLNASAGSSAAAGGGQKADTKGKGKQPERVSPSVEKSSLEDQVRTLHAQPAAANARISCLESEAVYLSEAYLGTETIQALLKPNHEDLAGGQLKQLTGFLSLILAHLWLRLKQQYSV
ncbi:hypothetical protein L207DRAFT_590023 [Hyaloscypha variabilis F]|uniref:Uncharacterized protein n=1 Tax=Hyaloscypha variabilis (strain UAMH 11265 / GT02V1 / F) TaxID=1149755 RepID=A0A2J6R386_HYAVF|nr:hypothetical protein L207DRAFT_590023 [Hyaloscypha variabilis F]